MIDKNIVRDAVKWKIGARGIKAEEILEPTGLDRLELSRFLRGNVDANVYTYIPEKLEKWLNMNDEQITNIARKQRLMEAEKALCKLMDLCGSEESKADMAEYLNMYIDEIIQPKEEEEAPHGMYVRAGF